VRPADGRQSGQNASMPDVSLYVALIAGAAGVGGAAISQFAVLARDSQQAKRDRSERRAEAKRQACLDLLRAAGELRTRLANTAAYQGTEMGARLAEVRECDAAVQLHAVSVALLAAGKLAEPAEQLATAVSSLVATATAAENIDTRQGEMLHKPDFTGLDATVAAFRRKAVGNAPA
jgi:hypothetical protein